MLGAEQAALEQHGLQELLNILNREFEYYKGAYQAVGTQVGLTWLALQIPPKSTNLIYIYTTPSRLLSPQRRPLSSRGSLCRCW